MGSANSQISTPVPFSRKSMAARNAPAGLINRKTQAEIRQILGASAMQAKLTVGAPDDVYEQEADHVADEVMRMPALEVQRMEAGEEEPEEEVQRKSDDTSIEDEADVEEPVSLKRADGTGEAERANLDSVVGSAFAGGGSQLSDSQRSFYESRFGADFSSVRVHTDGAAQAASQHIHAKAFTHGKDIAFANGAYQPETSEGQRLLAHELTHTIQQGAARQGRQLQRKAALTVSSSGAGVIQREKEIHLNLHYAIRDGSVTSPQTVRLYDSSGSTSNYTTSAGTGDRTSQHISRTPYHIMNKVGPPPAKTEKWGLQYFMPFVGGVGFHSNICYPRRSTLCADGASEFCSGNQSERVERILTVDGRPHSHGCARLSHSNAESLFNAVSEGTRVYVYERSSWRSPSWSSAADRAQPE